MTFTTYQTPAPLEAYLRRAALGLPPERREEVWNELEEHVLCRVEQLEFQGHPPGEALEQALRELDASSCTAEINLENHGIELLQDVLAGLPRLQRLELVVFEENPDPWLHEELPGSGRDVAADLVSTFTLDRVILVLSWFDQLCL